MAKDLLKGFEFTKFKKLDNGIEIPISNSLKNSKIDDVKKEVIPKNIITKEKAIISHKKSQKEKSGTDVSLPRNYDFKGKGIEPMINVMPTSSEINPKKKIKIQNDLGFDKSELGSLQTKEEKVIYLAMRGWRIVVERRRGALFHYATKYFNRKKERIYLGSINS